MSTSIVVASTPLVERFNSYVEQQGDCAVWTGGKTGRGYGVFFVCKAKGRSIQVYAHRASWEIHNGPIPDGQQVLHTCDNPPCVNPAHLFLGTQLDNMRDCADKGRWRNQCRLTPEIAESIRELYGRGGMTQAAIGAEFGIDHRHVSNIVNGKRWRKRS